MKKLLSLFLVALLGLGCTTAELQRTADILLGENSPLTNEEVGRGLKQALEIGIGKGSDLLSEVDGYYQSPYKILLPPEARKVTDRLQNVPGFTQLEEVVLEKINRGAEDAAAKAKPIFVDAIRQMTFADAMNILLGDKDAATAYLRNSTYDKLYAEFSPVIVNSLDKFDARQVWGDAVNSYNQIPFVEKADPDLGDYVTNQALDGLFAMVAREELNIRTNLAARTTDLLKRVFARQDK